VDHTKTTSLRALLATIWVLAFDLAATVCDAHSSSFGPLFAAVRMSALGLELGPTVNHTKTACLRTLLATLWVLAF
jgi:hypothetical protein